MAQIVLEHVEKVYSGGVKALDDLNLEVKEGEFMVLVGPSGCGKSTALRSIAGLEEITGGTISIGAQVVNDLPPKDRDIAMVFQNYALYPHMTVEANLAFGLKLRHTPKAEIKRRVGEAAAMLGLEPYLNRKPAALSGGQRQRVAMGRAIVREPQAFLMDEPLSNLDAKLRVSMRAALNQLHERLGITTVYVTHDQVEAMTLGDRVCVMRDGRIQQVDSPQRLFESPVNLFVAGFIGSPAMNFAPASLDRGDGGADGQLRRLPAAGARLGLRGQARARRVPGEAGHPRHPAVRLRGRRASATPPGRASRSRSASPRSSAPRSTRSSRSTRRRSSTPRSPAPPTAPRRRTRRSPRWPAARRCGPRGCPPGRPSGPGSRSSSPIDTSRLHFFDPASGESIGHPLTVGEPAGVAG